MKSIVAFFYGLILSTAAYGEITIQEAGLNNNVAQGANNVRVKVTNPSAAQDFIIRLSLDGEDYSEPGRSGFEYKVHLAAAEARILDLPIFCAGGIKLVAKQIDRDGLEISKAEKTLNTSDRNEVAVVCSSEAVCASTAQAIRAASTIEERNQRERLGIILVESPPESWLAYAAASTVVVAGRISSSAAREAITDYGRSGGKIIVAMDQAPQDFLADYRGTAGDAALGRGRILFVAHARGSDMENAFSESRTGSPGPIQFGNLVISFEMGASWLLERSATRFEFPHLGWLIGSMSAYILIIGLINFIVLRRMRKIELAWITVPALALVAGAIFYYFGTRGKAHVLVLDEANVCWMDDKSPRAVVVNALRISSPRVQHVMLKVPVSSVLTSSSNDALVRASDFADVWSTRRRARFSRLPDIAVDSEQHLPLEMLRYSFRDLEWESYRDFAGTVAFQGKSLKNTTGQNFRQAVLIDFKARKFFDLGAVSNGSEIDPFANTPQAMRGDRFAGNPNGVFDLRESVASWRLHISQPDDCLVFVGLSDQPLLQAQIEGIPFVSKVNTLFTVKVRRPR